jgi:hypothetical protein
MNDPIDTTTTPKRKWQKSHIFIILLLLIITGLVFFRFSIKSELQSKLDAIRAAGYPVTCDELDAWYPRVPFGEENAADTILEAFAYYCQWDEEALKKLPVVGEAELPARTEPLPEEMKTIIAAYLADNQQALTLLHQGAAMEHCRYPVDLRMGFNAVLGHLSDMRAGARMLHLEAILHAENNEPQLAVDSIKTLFGLAGSLENEPTLVSQLVRIACQSVGVSTIERLLNQVELTDSQLMELDQLLILLEKSEGMIRAIVGERCMTSSFLKNPTSQDLSLLSISPKSKPVIRIYNAMGLSDMDNLLLIDLLTKYIDALQLPSHQRIAAAEAVEKEHKDISRMHILLHKVMPALSRCVEIDVRCLANIQVVRVGIAIERYRLAAGQLPDDLGDLVPNYLDAIPADPFDGKKLRYKKLDKGFVVYSVGEDSCDDGGMEEKSMSGNRDITFTVER